MIPHTPAARSAAVELDRLVNAILGGYNATIFAYGPTGTRARYAIHQYTCRCPSVPGQLVNGHPAAALAGTGKTHTMEGFMYQDTRDGPSAYVGEAAEGSSGRHAFQSPIPIPPPPHLQLAPHISRIGNNK